jgi:putative phosphoesterase
MEIGVFSDVHGHLDELKFTLKLFDKLKVDKLVCCGDLVDKGDYSNEVVTMMHELDIPCVQGNHDKKAQFTWLTHDDGYDDQTIQYLTTLPTSLTYQWEDKAIHVCHANPWLDASYYIYPDSHEFLFQEVVTTVKADIVIMGHTHNPMNVTYDDVLMINPGSIYGNRDRKERTCGVLTLPECTFEVYNIETGEKLLF